MRSMTGFGRAEATAADAHIVIEIKTVNHRFLEVRTKIPGELSSVEPLLEKCIRNHLARGYCTVHLTLEQSNAVTTRIAESNLIAHIEQLKAVAAKTNIDVAALLPLLSDAPDLFSLSAVSVSDEIRDACVITCESALDKLIQMREKEGAHMTADIQQRVDVVASLNNEVQQKAQVQEKAVYDKYHQRISELMNGGPRSATPHSSTRRPDEIRIETEAAIFAEKADINEEINRLDSHINQMREVFKEPGSVGRRMDFLLQEMGREANTMASKSVLSDITHMVVAIKGELEKIRELIQNIE